MAVGPCDGGSHLPHGGQEAQKGNTEGARAPSSPQVHALMTHFLQLVPTS
jgi:hypothetical protein